jgi:hypothetical protein
MKHKLSELISSTGKMKGVGKLLVLNSTLWSPRGSMKVPSRDCPRQQRENYMAWIPQFRISCAFINVYIKFPHKI